MSLMLSNCSWCLYAAFGLNSWLRNHTNAWQHSHLRNGSDRIVQITRSCAGRHHWEPAEMMTKITKSSFEVDTTPARSPPKTPAFCLCTSQPQPRHSRCARVPARPPRVGSPLVAQSAARPEAPGKELPPGLWAQRSAEDSQSNLQRAIRGVPRPAVFQGS